MLHLSRSLNGTASLVAELNIRNEIQNGCEKLSTHHSNLSLATGGACDWTDRIGLVDDWLIILFELVLLRPIYAQGVWCHLFPNRCFVDCDEVPKASGTAKKPYSV